MEKRGLQSQVSQGLTSKGIAISCVPSYLFQTEIFIGSRPIKCDVADCRRDLRYSRDMLTEVAEHLVRLPRDGMTAHAIRRSEEDNSAALLVVRHRILQSACEFIDRRVSEAQ